jgi:hypothetical protein
MTAWLVLLPESITRASAADRSSVADSDGEAIERRLCLPEQVVQNTLRHIPQVARALAQVLVVNLGKCLHIARRHLMEARLDIPTGRFELADRFADQRLVLQHHQMRVENRGFLGPNVLLDLVLDLRNLLPRNDQGAIETRDLVDAFPRLDLVGRHLDIALQVHENLPIRDSLRGSDARHGDFGLRARIGH